jgi:hypothetical protein
VLDEVGAQHLQKLLSGFIENDQIHTCILAEPAVDSIFRRSINFCDELGPQLEEVYMFMRESEYDYDEWMRVIEEGCPDLDWVKDARRDEELPF